MGEEMIPLVGEHASENESDDFNQLGLTSLEKNNTPGSQRHRHRHDID
jgi:hypothetical protein